MPVQKFAPMTKDFPSFDCDAHVTEPPWLWERAKDWLTKDELEALKSSFWFDPESKRLLANGLGYANPASLFHGSAGMVNLLSLAGPGVSHDIQRALNVRNVQRKKPITKEQADYLDHKGSYLPEPNRLYFAALLPMQDAVFAEQEVYRVADKGCRVGLIRPIDALGNFPLQPKYGRVWRAMEETGVVYGMHPFPCLGVLKPPGYTEQCSGSELIALTASSSELPHNFLTNVQNFQAEASLWVTLALMSGFFERYPKIRAAVFEASSTWLTFLLDECDKAYELYRNDRRLKPLKRLPSETFFEHCVTGFEGDEAPPSRLPDFYENILAWSSDVYHHDGDDVWRAIETMRGAELPESYQAKFLGGNARKLYKIDAPKKFIRDRVTQIERPEWWPSDEEVRESLKPEAALRR